MSSNATLDQLRSYRTSATQALLDQHARKGLVVSQPAVTPFREAPAVTTPVATPAQCGYLADLLARLRTHAPSVHRDATAWIASLGRLDRTDASRAIAAVLRHLDAPAEVAPVRVDLYAEIRIALENVPNDRYYAIEAGPAGSNDWRFYKVTDGRVRVCHADGYGIACERLAAPAQLAAARAIAKDPDEAMLNFGRKIGRCGHCGRVLTNQASREAGIGPVCSSK